MNEKAIKDVVETINTISNLLITQAKIPLNNVSALELTPNHLINIGMITAGFHYIESTLHFLIKARYPNFPVRYLDKTTFETRIKIAKEFENPALIQILNFIKEIRNKLIHNVYITSQISSDELDQFKDLIFVGAPETLAQIEKNSKESSDTEYVFSIGVLIISMHLIDISMKWLKWRKDAISIYTSYKETGIHPKREDLDHRVWDLFLEVYGYHL